MNVIQETTAGGNLGNAFGTGLGAGLQSLANMKLNEITKQKQQAQTAQGLRGLFPNANPQDLQAWSTLSPELLNTVVKQKLQEPNNAAYGQYINQILNQGQEGGQPAELPTSGINSKQATDLANLTLKQRSTNAKIKAAEELENKKQAHENRKRQHEIDEKLLPFTQEVAKEHKILQQQSNLAKKMLKNLKDNAAEFPSALYGELPNFAQTGANVKVYISDLNKMIKLEEHLGKGSQQSNLRTRIIEAQKAGLNYPMAAREEILKSTEDREKEFRETTLKDIEEIKKSNGGNLSLSLPLDLINRSVAREDPLSHPEAYQENTRLEENGKIYKRIINEAGEPDWQEEQ
jgi:hypothetical protein